MCLSLNRLAALLQISRLLLRTSFLCDEGPPYNKKSTLLCILTSIYYLPVLVIRPPLLRHHAPSRQ